jgi:hypothetical protein
MPMIRRTVSVPANGIVDNLLQGSIYEYLPWNAAISAGVISEGAAQTDILLTVNSGSDTVMEEAPTRFAAAGTFPIIPDDMDIQDVAAGGERLILKARNTTGGALNVNLLVQLNPV